MSRDSWRIKPTEVERTLKSIQKVGLHIRTVEVSADGTIKIDVAETAQPNPADETSEKLRRLI